MSPSYVSIDTDFAVPAGFVPNCDASDLAMWLDHNRSSFERNARNARFRAAAFPSVGITAGIGMILALALHRVG